MNTIALINQYMEEQPPPKCADLQVLHTAIQDLQKDTRLWFLDGKNSQGKIVSNPNIGYGSYTIHYKDGTTKEFYRVGLSANTTGISVYIMGIKEKEYLADTYKDKLGKASITGYCIKFKTLKDIHIEVLMDAIRFGFEYSATR